MLLAEELQCLAIWKNSAQTTFMVGFLQHADRREEKVFKYV